MEIVRYPGKQPTLVFLHEGLGSVSAWRDFPETLAKETGLGALVYSRAGYGRSAPVTLPRPLTYMEDEARGPLTELLENEGEVILFGHSDGASIALIYAALHPVRALVLEAPHVFCEDLSVASIEKARQAYLHGDLRERLEKHHDDVDNAFWGWNGAWLDPGFKRWNIESFLPSITAPVLLIQGEADPYGTLEQARAIERGVRGPVEVEILPGCGHAPHKEQRDRTLEITARFLAPAAR